MSARYQLRLDCAYCKKLNNEVHYDTIVGQDSFECEFCGKRNKIVIEFSTQTQEEWEEEKLIRAMKEEDEKEEKYLHGF